MKNYLDHDPLPPLLSAQRGQAVGVGFLARVPFFSLCFAGPLFQSSSRYPRASVLSLSLSLGRGPALSAPPSPRPPWTSARALAHVAGNLGHVVLPHVPALFEHRLHPHSLPHLISRSLALASALSTPSDLAGDSRPPPRSSSSPEATPSDPELRPEVRHPSPRLFSPIHSYL